MEKLTRGQRKLLERLSSGTHEYWSFYNLWTFIDSESESGAFQNYSSRQAHFDIDKAKQDRFGRQLLQLHASILKSKNQAWNRFEEVYEECLAAGIPVEIVDRYETRARISKKMKHQCKNCFYLCQGKYPLLLQK